MVKRLIVTIVVVLASICSIANENDDNKVVSYINRIDLSKGDIVISDSFFKMDPFIKIFDSAGAKRNREFLKAGQRVLEAKVSSHRIGYHYQIEEIVVQAD